MWWLNVPISINVYRSLSLRTIINAFPLLLQSFISFIITIIIFAWCKNIYVQFKAKATFPVFRMRFHEHFPALLVLTYRPNPNIHSPFLVTNPKRSLSPCNHMLLFIFQLLFSLLFSDFFFTFNNNWQLTMIMKKQRLARSWNLKQKSFFIHTSVWCPGRIYKKHVNFQDIQKYMLILTLG